MRSIFRSPLWTARELFFILLVSVFIDRIAAARAEHQVTVSGPQSVASNFCSPAQKASFTGLSQDGQHRQIFTIPGY